MSAIAQVLAAIKGGPVIGQVVITSSGTWICPAGVTSVSVVTVGRGGKGYGSVAAGGGGALAYVNNIAVTPGNSYSVTVDNQLMWYSGNAADTNFANLVIGGSGKAAVGSAGGIGGAVVLGTGGSGGTGGGYDNYCGGGGAGGYAGAGGTGAHYPTAGNNGTGGTSGTGGAAAGGSAAGPPSGYGGGGVGLLGQGASGVFGQGAGGNGSCGGSGGESPLSPDGGGYGGGGCNTSTQSFNGGAAAIRIIWPGNLRQFPSTRTADE